MSYKQGFSDIIAIIRVKYINPIGDESHPFPKIT
jgi:hypothetical protein